MHFFLFFILWITGIPEEAPAKLLTFTGKTNGKQNVIEWRTIAETNTREFIIETSADGMRFELTAWVTPKGTQTAPAFYSYTDTLSNGKTWYRLRMVAADGKEQLSNVIVIKK